MQFFDQAVFVASLVGVAVVKKRKTNKGVEYVPSKLAMIPFFLQVFAVPWMIFEFRRYMSLKDYYSPNRKFQVRVLMYSEIAHCLCTVVCSFCFRFPHIRKLFYRCSLVMKDSEGLKVPYFTQYSLPLLFLSHVLLTVYRAYGSTRKPRLLFPFWIGMNQVIMVVLILFLALTFVDMSLKKICKDLTYIQSLRSCEPKFVKRQLILIRQRHYRCFRLLMTIREHFGPDVFVLCFFFLFKLTFVCYHIYYKKDISFWGQNPLVGELTGYFQILQLVVCSTKLAYILDKISEKIGHVEVTLLYLLKDPIEGNDLYLKNLIKTLIVQNKSCPRSYVVCNHFVFNRELIYNLILGAVTYVFILIQFQGIKKV